MTFARCAPFVLSVSLAACSSAEAPESSAGQGLGGQIASTGGAQQIGAGGAQPTAGAGGAQSGTGGSATGSRGSSVSFDGSRIQAQIIARSVAPGAEQHVCVVVELPNQNQVWIDGVHANLTGGSHHLIVDRQPQGTALELEPHSCTPTMASDATRLMIAQQAETSFTLPSGAAFSLEPHQKLFMQLHYFNSGSAVRDITGTVDMTLADPSGPTPTEAQSLFTGSLTINLAPNSPGQAQAFIVPRADTGTRHVFALTSHTHKLGVLSTIERVASWTAPPTTPIHESKNWDEPPLTTFDPPLDFDGSDGLRLICNYENTTSQTVTFGTPVDAEMCFMWVYFFDR